MRSAAAVLALFLCGSALAQAPTFNFLDLDYIEAQGDGDADANGYGVSLALPFPGSNNFIYGRYSTVDFDTPLGNAEFKRLRAGLGFASPLQGPLSLYTLFTWERAKSEGAGKDDGWGGELGLRTLLGTMVDLSAGYRYIDLDDAGDDSGFVGQLAVTLTPSFGIYAAYESLYDIDEWRFGVRLTNAN